MGRPRQRNDEDFAEEIRAHIALEADRLIDEGVNPDEARAIATRRFGNTLAAQERFYESRRWLWIDHLAADLRHAARSLTRYPLSCVVAIVSLGVGIGAASVTELARQAVFTSPPPLYAAPDQLSIVGVGTPDRAPGPVPAAVFNTWAEDQRFVDRLAVAGGSRPVDLRIGDRLDVGMARPVTPNAFAVLGVSAALGRTFAADDLHVSGPAPAVLSHLAWKRLFEGRADALGSLVWLNSVPHTIVGVMPERFWFVSMDAPIWTPLDLRAIADTDAVSVIARREPGVRTVDLSERLQPAVATYALSLPPERRQTRAVVIGVEGTPLGRAIGPIVLVLLSTSVLLTLLIACTNVAMLMIAQWTTREHEIAVRASLGASRGHIVRTLVAESALIALAGGALGLLATIALSRFLLSGDQANQFDLSIDPSILGGTAALTALVGLLTGLAPALYETRRLHINPLRHMRLSDRVRQRWRHALVVFEIGVTVALLVSAGAMVSASQRWMTKQPGFDPAPLAAVEMQNPARVTVDTVLDRLGGVPGVEVVAAASNVPIFGAMARAYTAAIDQAGSAATSAERSFVTPRFFDTLGVPLREGRQFTSADDSQAARVAMVNEALAERLWPGRSPLGGYVWNDEVAYQIVGVVASYGTRVLAPPRPAFYLPLAQGAPPTRLYVLVRAQADPAPLVAPLRREVRAASPNEVVASVVTLNQILDVGSREILAGVFPMAPLIATGLLLTAAGIFSVLAFAVSRRANELAVRIAIGADRADLLRLVSLQSARLVGLGMLIGIAATFGVTRLAQGTGSIFDAPGWQAFVIPIGIVLIIGVCATWIPLRRAMAINPATLLRAV